jgi:Mor family transcriptional regulator
MSDEKNWHESRQSIQNFINRVNQEVGLPAAQRITQALLEELGGQRVMVPTLQTFEQMEINEKICTLFTGANVSELAGRFNISERHIRRIVNNQKTGRNHE